MVSVVRKAVRLLLLNEQKQLLLLYAEDPFITDPQGKPYGPFWLTVGGAIEEEETLEEAAYRELKEETGLEKIDVTLGPIVWFGSFEAILGGTLMRMDQTFMVAYTSVHHISFDFLDPLEKNVIRKAQWFSLQDIQRCQDLILPSILSTHLGPLLEGDYPVEPLPVNLTQ